MEIAKKTVHDYMLSLPGTIMDFPFGEDVAVYKLDVTPHKRSASANVEPEYKMFALIDEKSDPVRISLKCDPELSLVLREKYETVMAGYHLNKKHWNTIILSGQLDEQEVTDLIYLSYQLVAGIQEVK